MLKINIYQYNSTLISDNIQVPLCLYDKLCAPQTATAGNTVAAYDVLTVAYSYAYM